MSASPPLLAVAFAASTVGIVGCTIRTIGSDAGPIEAGAQSIGDQCTAIADAFCTHAIGSCGVPGSLSSCIANEMPTCCTGSMCSAASLSSSQAVDACKAAIATETCYLVSTLGASGLSACQGIPKTQ